MKYVLSTIIGCALLVLFPGCASRSRIIPNDLCAVESHFLVHPIDDWDQIVVNFSFEEFPCNKYKFTYKIFAEGDGSKGAHRKIFGESKRPLALGPETFPVTAKFHADPKGGFGRISLWWLEYEIYKDGKLQYKAVKRLGGPYDNL